VLVFGTCYQNWTSIAKNASHQLKPFNIH